MLAGTIVASNYVPMAHVLATSYLRAHPDLRFSVLVLDDEPVDLADDRIDLLRVGDLGIDDLRLDVMRTLYDVREFATAVKPAFLRTLLQRGEPACYVDPDIRVYAPFRDVVGPAVEHDILLTPHVLHPVPRDGLDVSEETLRLAGMFNLGFLAVGRGADPFLTWWGERLLTDAVIDFPRGLFTDQRWVDWVPALFRHVVCRDPGMNIGWWNAHERAVVLDDHDGDPVPFVDGHPVRFVHYSGYDPKRPDVFSHWQPRPRQSWEPGEPLRVLAEQYGRELVESGHFDRRGSRWRYDVAADGTPLTPDLRARWRASLLDELADGRSLDRTRTPPAFGPRAGGFGRWLDGVGGGTVDHPHSRRERLVWERRDDLRGAFPDVDGADAAGFRRWLDVDPGARDELGAHRPVWYEPPVTEPGPPRSVTRRVASRGADIAREALVRTRARLGAGTEPAGTRPVAFLHVPKSAGTSLAAAVRQALPDRNWAPWVFDPDQFGPYADRDLPDDLASVTLPDPTAFRDYDAASGHFSLPSLLVGFDPDDVVVILREPRCRLLSLHEYWRNLDAEASATHDPWADVTTATAEADFGDWLVDPTAAYQTDNVVARMVVPHHPAIPADEFIPDEAFEAVARATIAELDRIGWVDVVERGEAMWHDLGRRLDVSITSDRRNVTVERSGRRQPLGQLLGAEAATNLRRRTAVDRAVWTWAARRRAVPDAEGLADVEWSRRVAAALDR